MEGLSPATLAALAGCILLATYIQTLTGFAFGLIFMGLASGFHLMAIPDAANAITLISLLQALIHFRIHPITPEWRVTRPVIAPMLLGVVAGVGLLLWLGGAALDTLRVVLGVAIVGSAGLLVWQAAPRATLSHPAVFGVAGVVAGLMGGLLSTNGPPLVYHFYRQPLSAAAIRQALVLLFGIAQALRLVLVLVSGQLAPASLWVTLLAAPLLWGVTRWMHRHPPRVSRRVVSRVVAVLLVLAGVGLIASGL